MTENLPPPFIIATMNRPRAKNHGFDEELIYIEAALRGLYGTPRSKRHNFIIALMSKGRFILV